MKSSIQRDWGWCGRFFPSLLLGLTGASPAWGELATWRALKAASSALTDRFALQAVDLTRDFQSGVQRVEPNKRVYVDRLRLTFWISLVVTVLCAAVGYPMAYLIANTGTRTSRVLLVLVLLWLFQCQR